VDGALRKDTLADVLIVDDDPDLTDTLANIVGLRGHRTRVAHDGREALAHVSEQRPDILLCDVEMPRLDGPDIAWLLHLRNCGDELIPVVLLSGVVDLARVADGVGTPYFLRKPYELSAIVQLLERALNERIAPTPRRHR
jgi:DNA-binding NtrC family response regulator